MNWFRQNRFLGGFLLTLAVATLLSLYFLVHEKKAAAEEGARLETTTAELTRLRTSVPFPNEENLRQTKAQTDAYRDSLRALEDELKNRMFPKPPLQPNEFQAQLRQATTEVIERARTSKVQLPDNFNLGFDEYASSLPNSLAAPRLGRQLRAIEWIANAVIDAHVDSLLSLTRTPLSEEKASPTPSPGTKGVVVRQIKLPATNEKVVDAAAINLTFAGSPAATRRLLNQIASAKEQIYVIRTLLVRNQVDKGPKRATAGDAAPAITTSSDRARTVAKPVEPAISFIVGTEHLNVAARIEILRFNFPEKGVR